MIGFVCKMLLSCKVKLLKREYDYLKQGECADCEKILHAAGGEGRLP